MMPRHGEVPGVQVPRAPLAINVEVVANPDVQTIIGGREQDQPSLLVKSHQNLWLP